MKAAAACTTSPDVVFRSAQDVAATSRRRGSLRSPRPDDHRPDRSPARARPPRPPWRRHDPLPRHHRVRPHLTDAYEIHGIDQITIVGVLWESWPCWIRAKLCGGRNWLVKRPVPLLRVCPICMAGGMPAHGCSCIWWRVRSRIADWCTSSALAEATRRRCARCMERRRPRYGDLLCYGCAGVARLVGRQGRADTRPAETPARSGVRLLLFRWQRVTRCSG